MTARVRKGDLVVVRSGDDAGRRGRVLRVLPGDGRAVVEGVNVVFKHLRRSQKNPRGGRVEKEAPVPLSRLMPVDPTTDEPTRVSYRVEGGTKRRFARGSGAALDVEARKGRRGKDAGEEKAKDEKEPSGRAAKKAGGGE
jgi:large subunit ribosomal protein L24